MKIYKTNNNKYKDKKYNILNVKLQVFYDYYEKIKLRQEYFIITFLIMLKKDIKYYYYNIFSGNSYDFNIII